MYNKKLHTYINRLYGNPEALQGFVFDLEFFGEEHFIKLLKEVGVEYYREVASKHGLPNTDIYIEFVNDNTVNALATYFETTPLICINIGCLLNVFHYSLLLTMRNDFFPSIGDLEECANTVKISDYGFPQISNGEAGLWEIEFYSGTDDVSRQTLATIITSMAHDFLVFHELGHHILGHTKYLSKVYGITYLQAQKSENLNQIDNVIIQSMEAHADVYAINALLNKIITGLDLYFKLDFLETSCDKTKVIFEMFITAISLVFLLLDNDGIDSDNFSSAYYLPRQYRLDLILTSFRDYIVKNHDNCLSKYCMQIDDLYLTIAQIYHENEAKIDQMRNHSGFNSNDELSFENKVSIYYKTRILTTWELLKRDLSSYAIVELI